MYCRSFYHPQFRPHSNYFYYYQIGRLIKYLLQEWLNTVMTSGYQYIYVCVCVCSLVSLVNVVQFRAECIVFVHYRYLLIHPHCFLIVNGGFLV